MSRPEAEADPIVANVVRAGLWCNDCLTPSALELDIVTMDDGGATVVATLEGCRRCGTGVCSDER